MKKIILNLGIFIGILILGIIIIRGIIGVYGNSIKWFCIILAMLVGVLIYILPTIIAVKKRSQNLTIIIILNVFFGWTLFGWGIALLKALKGTQK